MTESLSEIRSYNGREMNVETPKEMRISRQPSAIQITGTPRCVTVCFATIHNKDGCENKAKNVKTLEKFKKKGTSINTRCDLKKQHSQ